MSEMSAVTMVSNGAEAIPCKVRRAANEGKDLRRIRMTQLDYFWETSLTFANAPHTFVMTMIKMEPRMKGRFPIMFDPAAVTEAVKPVQKTNKPIVHVEAVSTLTENSCEMMGIAGVSMTDMLP